MQKIKTIIIDDEPLARQLIKEFCESVSQIEIIDECQNGVEAVKKINLLNPDLVFLDIQMPGKDGFEVLEDITNLPKIIFTTAYDEFAVKAFEKNALDYLLKPFDEERFCKAVERIVKVFEIKPSGRVKDKIFIRSGSSLKFLKVSEILYLEAENDYTKVVTENDEFLLSKNLSQAESNLPKQNFLRVHRSFVINLEKCVNFQTIDNGKICITVTNQEKIICSRSGSKRLREMLF
ncbi:MAG: response regulator [Calditrichaeota bacterium]|nr:MAG: response regulator [Calditrichota bacterium]